MDFGDPIDYEHMIVSLRPGMKKERNEVLKKLVTMQYTRNELDFKRGTFRAKGDIVEIYPSDQNETAIRVEFWGDEVEKISEINPLTGKVQGIVNKSKGTFNSIFGMAKKRYETKRKEAERIEENKNNRKPDEILPVLEGVSVKDIQEAEEVLNNMTIQEGIKKMED